jgi:hypothetical protein
MEKSKSMKGRDGERKLAAQHGREKAKSGGEPKKKSDVPRDEAGRSGSSKQRKA